MAEFNIPGSSLSAGSESVFDVVCQPCSSGDINAEAEGYCEDCGEHLCAPCIAYHKRLMISKHHKIVGKDEMPQSQDTPMTRDVCTERCRLHKEEIVKYFCPVHHVLACIACVTLKHNTCGVTYIPDVAAEIEDSQDYRDFKANIVVLVQKSKQTTALAQDSINRSSYYLTTAMKNIEAYREEIVSAVNRRVNDLKEEARKINSEDTERMTMLVDHSNQTLTELQTVLSDVDTLVSKKQLCQAFIEMKKKGQSLTKLQESLDDLSDADVTEYTFQPEEELQTQVTRENGFGKLVTRGCKEAKSQTTVKENHRLGAQSVSVVAAKDIHQIKATRVADIKVNTGSGSNTGTLSGAALLSKDRLIVADVTNRKVFVINTVNYEITSEFNTTYTPWDVAASGNKVFTTLAGVRRILSLQYDGKLQHSGEFGVDGSCRGITCVDEKLYVVFDEERKLEVLTMTGVVLQRFDKNDQGEPLFQDPTYVAISTTNQAIYVSEYVQSKLIILNMDGKLKGVYSDKWLCRPRQLVVDTSGMMFLCDRHNDTVHLLSPQCSEKKILLTKTDEVKEPRSICYCEDTNRLYVGMQNSNTMRVYQIA